MRASADRPTLSDRQAAVLRALATSYVGEAGAVGSQTIAHLLPVMLSSASVRNTLAELTEMGLVEKAHASSGRVPTELGLRVFVDALLAPADVSPSQRRDIAWYLEDLDAGQAVARASELLSRHSRQLGFVVAPRLERLVLQHVSIVRLARERLLVVQGTAFNWPEPDHFRVVTLPRVADLEEAIARIARFLESYQQ